MRLDERKDVGYGIWWMIYLSVGGKERSAKSYKRVRRGVRGRRKVGKHRVMHRVMW